MSSFIKKNPRLSGIIKSDETSVPNKTVPSGTPGLTPSLTGASSLLSSTGIPDLDVCLGGGLPPGSLLTAFEDFPASRANYTWTAILRCFLAEGLATASLDWTRKDGGWILLVGHDITGILASLPKPELSSSKESNSTDITPLPHSHQSSSSDAMKIAWRYEGMKEFDSNLKRPISALTSTNEKTLGHTFDLGRKHEEIPKQMIDSKRALELDLSNDFDGCHYKRTWSFLQNAFSMNKSSGLGRIVIGSIAAPGIWNCTCTNNSSCGPAWLIRNISNHIQETEFSHPCIALVTIPTSYLTQKLVIPVGPSHNNSILLPSWVSAIENLSDAVFELKSITGLTYKSATSSNRNLINREYDGFFVIRKHLRRPNSFKPFLTETSNLVFKIKRRRFGIEKFHLPPALDSESPSASLCSSSKDGASIHPFDF